MDELGLQALHRRVAGIDVHRMLHLVTVLIEQKARPDPSLAHKLGPPQSVRLSEWLGRTCSYLGSGFQSAYRACTREY